MITGSSRGLGRGLALKFAENGYNVIIHGRNKQLLSKVKKEIEKNNVSCHIVVGDLKSEEVLDTLSTIAKNPGVI